MLTVLQREALERAAERERAGQQRTRPRSAAELVNDEILTAREVAAILRLTRKTVIELIGRGELPGRKIGNSWRVSKKELMQRCFSRNGNG